MVYREVLIEVVDDYNQLLEDQGEIENFNQKWTPRNVAMENFDQRIQESGLPAELRIMNHKYERNTEHFWLISDESIEFSFLFPSITNSVQYP